MNPWKILALVMIALLIIVTGIRFAFMEAHSFQLSKDQKIFVINKAQEGLRAELGDNKYNITAPDKGRIIPSANGDKKVALVILYQGNITLTALVDMETGDLVEIRRMEQRGWMTENLIRDPGRWGHQRLFGR